MRQICHALKCDFWNPCVVILLSLFASSTVQAEVLVYEAFDTDQVAKPLAGLNQGQGFPEPWKAGGFNAGLAESYTIQQGSLAYPGLATSGHRVSAKAVESIAGLTRNFAEPLGEDGSVLYLSFLIRPEGELNGGAWNGFFGIVLEQLEEPELFIGKPGDGKMSKYVLENRGSPLQIASDLDVQVDQASLLVVRIEFFDGNDRFTLFTNPTVGEPEPEKGIVKHDVDVQAVEGLTIYSTGAFSLDEIRIGETFADVVPLKKD